jgi:hypothetical protein
MMSLSVPLMTGRWFIAIQILHCGLQVKNSPYRNRHETESCPVTASTFASARTAFFVRLGYSDRALSPQSS